MEAQIRKTEIPRAQASRATSLDRAGTPTASPSASAASPTRRTQAGSDTGPAVRAARRRAVDGALSAAALLKASSRAGRPISPGRRRRTPATIRKATRLPIPPTPEAPPGLDSISVHTSNPVAAPAPKVAP